MMAYYNGKPTPHRRRKRRRSQPGLLRLLGYAFGAFVVVGLAVMLIIRGCARQSVRAQEPASAYTDRQAAPLDDTPRDLPVEQAPTWMDDYDIELCTARLPEGAPEMIVVKAAYIASFNRDTKIPNYVAWHLTSAHTDGPYPRLNNFHEEQQLAGHGATLGDYRGSGWSRGHMCPAGDNKWDDRAMYDSFSLVNVCPQNANLNSGLWNSIEIDCRRWARRFGDVYIICGPVLFNRDHATIGDGEVVVPEAFFKVVLCLSGEPKALGFIVRNTDGNQKRDLYYNSIDEVERITGIDFFAALPDELEDSVEAVVDRELWR